MTALEKQTRLAGIDFKILEEKGELVRVSVNGKEYIMSTAPQNYGRLVGGGTIFKLLSSIANLKKAQAKRKEMMA